MFDFADVKVAEIHVERIQNGNAVLWRNGEPFATVDPLTLFLVVAGARQMNVSVYDVDNGVYLTGTIDQLAGQ